LEHRNGKRRYQRTDRKSFIRQLTQIERRQTHIRRIKSHLQKPRPSEAPDSMAYEPRVHHHIGVSEKVNNDIGSYLRLHEGDPAMQVHFSIDDLLIAEHALIIELLFTPERVSSFVHPSISTW
jgi:hypothetical protein